MQLDPCLINDFVVEAQEHLEAAEPLLLEFEKQGVADAESINGVFRAVHSIKGASGFLGLENIQTLTHALETLLMRVRDGELAYRPEMTDALLRGVDRLRELLAGLPADPGGPAAPEIAVLERLAGDVPETKAPACEPPSAEVSEESQLASACREQRRRGHHLVIVPLPARKAERSARLERCGRFGELVREGEPTRRKAIFASPLEIDLFAEAIGLAVEKLAPYEVPTEGKATGDLPRETDRPLRLYFGQIGIDLGFLSSDERDHVLEVQSANPPPKRSFGAIAVGFDLLTVDQIDQMRAEQLVRLSRYSGEQARVAFESEIHPELARASEASERRAESVRVAVSLLDTLMNLAGELVLGRNRLRKLLETSDSRELKSVLQNIDLVTTELQENIMNTRMQPVRVLFDRLPRLTRDIARLLGKNVNLEMIGGDVELDRSIIEALADPMLHLMRNAVDHGLEHPEGRSVLGKSAEGRVCVRAYHERGRVVIEVQDDGRGIDAERVIAAAVDRGAISREHAAGLSERDAIFLVFQAGLTTAAEVTEVSGRGVGMDVVRSNIERLGGQIDVESSIGEGTTFQIHLPLTLAIIPSLIISVADERFAIPQINVLEVVRLGDELRVERVRETEVVRLRNSLLPLVRVRESLEFSGEPPDGQSVVVLRCGSHKYGLVVDGLHDTEEIVVKPLSTWLSDCGWYAGTAILGDGRVALIFDAVGVAKRAGIRFEEIAEEGAERAVEAGDMASSDERGSFVVFENGPNEHFAMRLDELLRLERVETSQVERFGEREFLVHRGRSLPLLRLENLLPVGAPEQTRGGDDDFFVLIPRLDGVHAGIVATRIVDTIESSVTPEPTGTTTPGVKGSAILHDRMTLFLDPAALVTVAGLEPRL